MLYKQVQRVVDGGHRHTGEALLGLSEDLLGRRVGCGVEDILPNRESLGGGVNPCFAEDVGDRLHRLLELF